jgi:hypothetical protein
MDDDSRRLCLVIGGAATARIGGDLFRTTGHHLEVVCEPDEHFGALATVRFDGSEDTGFSFAHDTVEDAIADIADLLREHLLDEAIWGGWPTCARHHTHPYTPTVRDQTAVWWCPVDDVVAASIGELQAIG